MLHAGRDWMSCSGGAGLDGLQQAVWGRRRLWRPAAVPEKVEGRRPRHIGDESRGLSTRES